MPSARPLTRRTDGHPQPTPLGPSTLRGHACECSDWRRVQTATLLLDDLPTPADKKVVPAACPMRGTAEGCYGHSRTLLI